MSVKHEKTALMADDDQAITPRFETTSALQIKIRVPRSPSPNAMTSAVKTLRSTSTTSRPSRLESRPPTRSAAGNQLAVSSNRSQYSRSLSPRPQRTSEVHVKPPPPSPAGLLPTRSPTPPNKSHYLFMQTFENTNDHN